jgi:hypothetical protein
MIGSEVNFAELLAPLTRRRISGATLVAFGACICRSPGISCQSYGRESLRERDHIGNMGRRRGFAYLAG